MCRCRSLQNVLKAKCSHYTYEQTHIVREKKFITHNPGQLPCFSKQLLQYYFSSNWNEVGFQNIRRRNIYISVHFYSSWRSELVDPGKPQGEYEPMALFRKALQMDGRRKVKSSGSCFSGNAYYSRQSGQAFPWLFTLRWPMFSSGGFGRKRTITAFLSLL